MKKGHSHLQEVEQQLLWLAVLPQQKDIDWSIVRLKPMKAGRREGCSAGVSSHSIASVSKRNRPCPFQCEGNGFAAEQILHQKAASGLREELEGSSDKAGEVQILRGKCPDGIMILQLIYQGHAVRLCRVKLSFPSVTHMLSTNSQLLRH